MSENQMLALARLRGGPDNITVALVHIALPGARGTDGVRETRAVQVSA